VAPERVARASITPPRAREPQVSAASDSSFARLGADSCGGWSPRTNRPPTHDLHVKHTQRLGYQRLAEVLMERGLVEAQAVRDALEMGQRGSLPFPEALVSASLVADWELSRIVCEVFGLPFLPIEIITPDPNAMEGLNLGYLMEHGLVPLSRYGKVLTVAMPAVVPAEILSGINHTGEMMISPVVGTVRTNRRWIDDNLTPKAPLPTELDLSEMSADGDGEWANIFDEGDAAVQLELGDEVEEEFQASLELNVASSKQHSDDENTLSLDLGDGDSADED